MIIGLCTINIIQFINFIFRSIKAFNKEDTIWYIIHLMVRVGIKLSSRQINVSFQTQASSVPLRRKHGKIIKCTEYEVNSAN